MKTSFPTSMFGLLAFLALGGAAQASDAGVTIRVSDYRYIGGDRFSGGEHFDRPRYHEDDRRDWRGSHGRPGPHWHHARPVFGRPGWGRFDDCRVIVRRHINRWGEHVVRRLQVCD